MPQFVFGPFRLRSALPQVRDTRCESPTRFTGSDNAFCTGFGASVIVVAGILETQTYRLPLLAWRCCGASAVREDRLSERRIAVTIRTVFQALLPLRRWYIRNKGTLDAAIVVIAQAQRQQPSVRVTSARLA